MDPQPDQANEDAPRRWLGNTALLDLDDPKLRLKARSLTQLCKTEREKALAIYAYVKRLEYAKPFKLGFRTARQVLDAGRGDADDKATLLVALLRAAGIPARLNYVEVHGDIVRGLVPNLPRAGRPLAEIWLGRWLRTDTYIFDAAYLAAARQRLKEQGWPCGYGIHVSAQSVWCGTADAFLGGVPTEQDPLVLRSIGRFSDVRELVSSQSWRRDYRLVLRALRWNMVAPAMRRVIRKLREESVGAPMPAPRRIS